jgi:hypothetical protein
MASHDPLRHIKEKSVRTLIELRKNAERKREKHMRNENGHSRVVVAA